MTTSCPDEQQLDDFIAGALSAGDSKAIDTHLRSCKRCAAWMRGSDDEDERMLASVREIVDGETTAPGVVTEPASTDHGDIAGYRIVRQIGEGGMGIVFEAEQRNPQRRVALKVVRPGAASERALRRLEHEAQALARLQHPGIAQIHEAGAFATAQGTQPFFAMQLVEGKPLLQHAADADLDQGERLRLLAEICAAVHHAHQRGVIHRDLKPSNILVDGEGHAIVLDFGVARLRGDGTEELTLSTHVGQVVGTVPYMSPEQLSGDPGAIDVQSDVWALGVIGYQLLTDRLPLDLEDRSLTEAIRIVQSQRPVPLRTVDRRMAGDLDTIFGTALDPDRGRRYASASELQSDLERYLAHRPIAARPPGTLYTLGLWVRRHMAWATAAVIVVLVTIAAFAITAREMFAAQRASAKSDAVNTFFSDLLSFGSGYERSPGPDFTMREALGRAEKLIDNLRDQPEVEASVRFMIAGAYQSLQALDRAQEQFDRVLALRRAAHGDRHAGVAEVLNQLAMIAAGRGNLDESDRLFREALDIHRAVHGSEHSWVGRVLTNLGTNARQRGDMMGARKLLEQAVAVLRSCEDADRFLAVSLSHLAYVRGKQGDAATAEELYRASLAAYERAGKERHAFAAFTKVAFAQLLVRADRHEEAEPMFVDALAGATRVLGTDHPQTVNIRTVVVDFFKRRGMTERAAQIESASQR